MTGPVDVALLSLQVAILATLAESLRRRNVAAALNALVALVAALLPAAVEALLPHVAFPPELPLWVALAGFLHALGMLGLYESTWWWDHLTHTVSAALVAALLYAGVLVAGRVGFAASRLAAAAVTLAFTFAVGVFWELVELVARDVAERYDVDPVLVHYGWRDTAYDLAFDVVGAVLVVALDLRVFVPLARAFPRATRWLVLGGGGVVVVGSLLMALGIGLDHDV